MHLFRVAYTQQHMPVTKNIKHEYALQITSSVSYLESGVRERIGCFQ